MTEIDVEKMVPGTVYRVTYELGVNHVTHEGNYIRRAVTATGDYLVFEPSPEVATQRASTCRLCAG